MSFTFRHEIFSAGRRQSYIVSKLHLRNSAEWKTIEGVLTSKTNTLNSVFQLLNNALCLQI